MDGRSVRLLLVLCLAAVSRPCWGQMLDDFPRTTLKAFEKTLPKRVKMQYSCPKAPKDLSASLSYLGKFRKLQPVHRDIVDYCTETWQMDQTDQREFFSQYDAEVLLSEDGKARWFPVQTSFPEGMKDEARKWDPLFVYLRYVGRIKGKPVYYMVEFMLDEEGYEPKQSYLEERRGEGEFVGEEDATEYDAQDLRTPAEMERDEEDGGPPPEEAPGP